MRIWSEDEIAERLIARTVVRSGLSDLRETDPSVQACRAFAKEIVDTVNTVWAARDDNYFGTSADAALDEILADILPAGVSRGVATRGVGGAVVFSRPAGSSGVVNIPAGAPVSRSKDGVVYRTIAATSFGVAALTSSPAVSVAASVLGIKGNCEASEINRLASAITGVTGVLNTASINNAVGGESDEDARQTARDYVAGISPAVPAGILARVKAINDPTYGKVRFAKWLPMNGTLPGYRELVIDDGNATSGPTTTIATGEVLLSAATGTETLLYLRNRPVALSPILSIDAVPMSPAPYWTPPWGQAALRVTLSAGEQVTAGTYAVYGGLVAVAQRLIDGDPTDIETYPGIGGLGDVIRVLPARMYGGTYTSISYSLETVANFDGVAAELAKTLALYVNGLDIGESLVIAEIIRIVKSHPLVLNVGNVLIGASASDLKPDTDSVIRTRESQITAS